MNASTGWKKSNSNNKTAYRDTTCKLFLKDKLEGGEKMVIKDLAIFLFLAFGLPIIAKFAKGH